MKLNFGDKLNYFFRRGAFLGMLVGTAFLPILGTSFGLILGGIVGIVCSIITNLLVVRSQAAFFNEEFDVEGYGRWLAIRASLYTSTTIALVYMIGMRLVLARIDEFHAMVFLGSFFLIWIALMCAYTARNYPLWLVQHMVSEKQLSIDPAKIPTRPKTRSLVWKLYRGGPRLWQLLIGMGSAAFISALQVNSGSYYPPEIVARNIFIGAVASEVMWIHLATANGLLLTVLKRVILNDYFPDIPDTRSRRILAGVSFVVTLLMSIWTLVFAPLIAILMARTVYRTLALPDEALNKAKRKEKNALALEDDIDEEDEMLLVEEERLVKARQ